MTLDEFRRHPAYDYYIITLVSDCLVCDLETKFDNQYTIIYMKRPNFENKRKDYGYLNPYYRAAYSIPKRKR